MGSFSPLSYSSTGGGGTTERTQPVITNRYKINAGATGTANVFLNSGTYNYALHVRDKVRITNPNAFALYLFFVPEVDDFSTRDQYSYDCVVPPNTTGEVDFLDNELVVCIGFGGTSTTTQPVPISVVCREKVV